MKRTLKFPKNFLWGTATSAYQVEGGIKNDWTEAGKKFDAGKSCDHYNRFEKDFDSAKSLNNNAHRFSIEWARIEPEEGKFDQKEIEHYRKVIQALRKRNLEPFVTLWHWTNPVWFAEKGGWERKKNIKYFLRYVDRISQGLGRLVKFWIVLNEPMVFIGTGYLKGSFPPQERNIFKARRIFKNLVKVYRRAYKIIHSKYPKARVSIAQAISYFEPARKWCPVETFMAWLAHCFWNHRFLKKVENQLDYIGLNYYTLQRIVWHPPFKKNLNKEVTDLGWEIYPEGIFHVLKYLSKFEKPIYITENGLADAKDKKRTKFIIDHLKWIHKAIDEGINVRGYFHWSLIDNFEWIRGFSPRFGLFEVNYKTQKRIPRPSSKVYARICKSNSIEIE